MIVAILLVLGLCFGSFVNALVWRMHEQSLKSSKPKKGTPKPSDDLSIMHGRSMCPHCRHTLAAKDLLPVISWVSLGGKCRYCHKSISWHYPVVELKTAALFIISYAFWPFSLSGVGALRFGFWLVFIVGLVALAVYDLYWYLLPNRLVYPLLALAALQVVLLMLFDSRPGTVLFHELSGFVIGGGLFYLLFQISDGKWIGGGDVKLGGLLGLLVAGPTNAVLVIFLASFIGSALAIPLLITKRAKATSKLPFGPFLIAAVFIVYLFGDRMVLWYSHLFLMGYM